MKRYFFHFIHVRYTVPCMALDAFVSLLTLQYQQSSPIPTARKTLPYCYTTSCTDCILPTIFCLSERPSSVALTTTSGNAVIVRNAGFGFYGRHLITTSNRLSTFHRLGTDRWPWNCSASRRFCTGRMRTPVPSDRNSVVCGRQTVSWTDNTTFVWTTISWMRSRRVTVWCILLGCGVTGPSTTRCTILVVRCTPSIPSITWDHIREPRSTGFISWA